LLEGLEGQALQFIQVAQGEQALAHCFGHVPAAANAHFQASKIRVAGLHLRTQIPQAAALLAIWVACQVFNVR
jgi:hypothetical protein